MPCSGKSVTGFANACELPPRPVIIEVLLETAEAGVTQHGSSMEIEHTERVFQRLDNAHVAELLPLVSPSEMKQVLPMSEQIGRAHV